jgi:aminoglycoside/choline kinase family phosphotransferase
MTDRDTLRAEFINRCGWDDAEVEPLPFDASMRRYYRLRRGTATTMVMDAPPEKGEAVAPFIMVDEHLLRLGLSAPVIHERDVEQGFLRLEDFGDDTFLNLLAAGHDETALYELATDSIIVLQSAPQVMNIDVTSYLPRFTADLELLLQWYVPEQIGRPASEECRMRFYQAWDAVLSDMPAPKITLMLRDYHVGNLMLLDRPGVKACGLLDFQSAEFAPRPYDLMCLLEDARRDVSPALREAMLERYSAALPIDDSFRAWYAAIAVQRYMRVLGNFSRQALQNKNFSYQVHIPRVKAYLEKSLEAPQLAPVREWLERWVGGLTG